MTDRNRRSACGGEGERGVTGRGRRGEREDLLHLHTCSPQTWSVNQCHETRHSHAHQIAATHQPQKFVLSLDKTLLTREIIALWL